MRWQAVFLLCLLSAGGCVSQADEDAYRAVNSYFAGDYEGARQTLDPLARTTDENFVLNNARLGSAAIAEDRISDAQDAFLRAYEAINSVGVNNGGRTLGATLVSERIKVWKGEPFEQAMANYYLGLTYYMRLDYPNARAAFENALFKLHDYGPNEGDLEADKYQNVDSDFTLAYLMLGKSWQRLGDDQKAQQMFDRVTKLRPDLSALADARLNGESNLLLVIDWGYGPTKALSRDGSLVGFAPKPWQAGPIVTPVVYVDGQVASEPGVARPPVDLLAVAQERRWQSIDTIRAIKSVVGSGLIVAGAYEGAGREHPQPGLAAALIGAGILMKASSQADTRQWEMLPRTSFVVPMRVKPGSHDVTIYFSTGQKQVWRGIVVPATGEATYYMRMTSFNVAPQIWPPPGAQ